MATHPAALAPAPRRAFAAVRSWARRRLLQPLVAGIKIVNGQAGYDELKTFMLENEAVNTALATRVLQLESRVRLLTVLGAIVVFAELLHWIVR